MNYREILIRLVSMTTPFVYDSEESFLEMLRKFYKYLHELTIATKDMSDEITEIRDEMTSFENEIEQTIENINHILADYDMKIEKVENDLRVYVNSEILNLRHYVDTQDNIIKNKIDQIELGNIELYDPTTGLKEPLQTIINNLYDMNRVNALTATEYDALDLTATEYDTYNLTATQYDLYGKDLLV